MTSNSKFLFDTEFAVASRRRTPERPQPRYTEEELAAARGDGQRAGVEMGLAQARGEAAHAAAQALERIAAGMAELAQRQEAALEGVRAEAARLALAIARRLAGELLRRQPEAEIEALVGQLLQQLPGEPRVVVRVAEGLVQGLSERLDEIAIANAFAGRVVLLGEPHLREADARIEWADGGAERNFEELMAQVEESVRRYCDARAAAAAETLAPAVAADGPAVRPAMPAPAALDDPFPELADDDEFDVRPGA